MHKQAQDPNAPVTVPGVPAVAPPKLLKEMRQQDLLLQKIVKMEKTMAAQDPNHQKSRSNWLQLAHTVRAMPAGPNKLKSETLLLKLAKEMSQKEAGEIQEQKEGAPEKKMAPTEQAAAEQAPPAMAKSGPPAVQGEDAALRAKRALIKRVLVTKAQTKTVSLHRLIVYTDVL